MKLKFRNKRLLPRAEADKPIGVLASSKGSDHRVTDVIRPTDAPEFAEGKEDPLQSAELERQQDA